MSYYTAGKVKVGQTIGNQPTIEAEESSRYAIALVQHRGPVAWADARRLVACWNACAGVSTDDLERQYNAGGGIDKAMDEASLRDHVAATARLHEVATLCATVEQERDQLLAALHKIGGFTLSQFMGPHDMALECGNVARAAIAAVEQAK